jgi:hypothetical protein
VKPTAQWVENYKGSAGTAQTAYTAGVNASQKDWASLTTQAIPSMVQGFNQAAADGRIAQGINARGTGYWKSQTVAKAQSYSQGIALGGDNYNIAAQKISQALTTGISSLGARGPRGSEQNFGRSRQLGLYLHSLQGQLGAK